MSKVDALMKKGSKDLGRALIEKAIEKQNECVTNEVVAYVQDIMAAVQKNEEFIKYLSAGNEFFKQKLEAIEKGQFTVAANGKLQLDEPELRKHSLEMPAGLQAVGQGTCRNCGYPINR